MKNYHESASRNEPCAKSTPFCSDSNIFHVFYDATYFYQIFFRTKIKQCKKGTNKELTKLFTRIYKTAIRLILPSAAQTRLKTFKAKRISETTEKNSEKNTNGYGKKREHKTNMRDR